MVAIPPIREPHPLRQGLHRAGIVPVAAFIVPVHKANSLRDSPHRGKEVIRWAFTTDRCIARARPVVSQCPALPPPGVADVVIQHMPELVDDRRLDKPVHQVHGAGQDKIVTEQAAMLEAHRQVFPHPLHLWQQASETVETGFDGENGRLEGDQFTFGPVTGECEIICFFQLSALILLVVGSSHKWNYQGPPVLLKSCHFSNSAPRKDTLNPAGCGSLPG